MLNKRLNKEKVTIKKGRIFELDTYHKQIYIFVLFNKS
jgi:hypothetical protein